MDTKRKAFLRAFQSFMYSLMSIFTHHMDKYISCFLTKNIFEHFIIQSESNNVAQNQYLENI